LVFATKLRFVEKLPGSTTIHAQSHYGNNMDGPIETTIPARVDLHTSILSAASFHGRCPTVTGKVVNVSKTPGISSFGK
jgi:hypothetical protein